MLRYTNTMPIKWSKSKYNMMTILKLTLRVKVDRAKAKAKILFDVLPLIL